MTPHEHAVATRKNTAVERPSNPVHEAGHARVSTLIQQARPDLDATLLAHVILSSLHTEPIAQLLRDGGSRRLATCLHDLVTALLTQRTAQSGQR